MGIAEKDPLAQLSLPPGFRFFPTDEELLVQYLCRKVAGHHFSLPIIAEVDLYKFDPWVLPGKAIFGEKEWYFFSPRDRKYPNGSRPNRVAGSGYWKATGTDKIIATQGKKVGIKKALVFYVGKAPKGTKTNWIMHEYRLLDSSRKNNGSSKLDEWVLCRIYKKNSGSGSSSGSLSERATPSKEYSNGSSPCSSSHVEDMLDFPDIQDQSFALPRINSLRTLQEDKFLGNFGDWFNPPALDSVPEFLSVSGNQSQGMLCNDLYAPAVPAPAPVPLQLPVPPSMTDEEVQSGITSGFYHHNPNARLMSPSGDPFAFGYPTHQSGFGYRRN